MRYCEEFTARDNLMDTLKKVEMSMKKLTVRQQTTLKKHAKHHTKKHMASMRSAMRKGKTFGAAHKEAMKKVGR